MMNRPFIFQNWLLFIVVFSCTPSVEPRCIVMDRVGVSDVYWPMLIFSPQNDYCFQVYDSPIDTLFDQQFKISSQSVQKLHKHFMQNPWNERLKLDGQSGYRIMVFSNEGEMIYEDFVIAEDSYLEFRRDLLDLFQSDSLLSKWSQWLDDQLYLN